MDPPDRVFVSPDHNLLFGQVVCGCLLYIITEPILGSGVRMFGATAVAISYVIHDISAIVMLGGIFIHIYQSTIGEPGTFGAMIRGAVSEAWAWTFHPAWYKQVTGRDPQQAYEEARRLTSGSKP